MGTGDTGARRYLSVYCEWIKSVFRFNRRQNKDEDNKSCGSSHKSSK